MEKSRIKYGLMSLFFWMCCLNVVFGQNYKDSLNAARKAYADGNYKQALKYYKSATRLAPKDVDLSMEAGQTAYKAGDFKSAETYYGRAASGSKDPKKKSSATTNLGMTRMKQQNYDGAIAAFKDALRTDSSNEKARQLLAEAQRQKKKQEQQQKQNQNQEDQQKQEDQTKQDQNSQNKPQQQNKQQQANSQQNAQKQASQQQQLKDKETERKLDDLQRQEMVTKKRVDGSKGNKGGQKAGKDW